MVNLKSISRVLIVSLFFQSISSSYGAGRLTVTFADPIVSEDEVIVRPTPERKVQIVEITPAQLEAGSAVIIETTTPVRAELSDMDVRPITRGEKIGGTLLFLVLIATGTLVALWQKGFFNSASTPTNSNPTTFPPVFDPTAPISEISSINFAGFDWNIKMGQQAPGPNKWANTTNAIFIDKSGKLNLKVIKSGSDWLSSEIALKHSFGYGTYEFDVQGPVNSFDSNLAAAASIYADDSREFDVQFSKWQDPSALSSQYVVQPSEVSGNLHRFQLKAEDDATVKHRITWSKDSVIFESIANSQVLSFFNYTGKYNFVPGNESIIFNNWMIKGTPPSDQEDHALVIKSFKFSALQ